jgi:DNA repair protein RecO (recombination protein O)
MPDPREYQTEAVIIRKTKLGEADRILTLYTRDHGKIEVFAKGVRRPKSKLAGHLELLTYSLVRLARGRNLDTVTGSQTIEAFLPLKNDIWLTSYGLYAAELVNQFNAERSANQQLFQLLVETLRRLSQAESSELTMRYFELRLLDLSGYRPQLQECVTCLAELKPVENAFCSAAGGILCPACQYEQPTNITISVDVLKVLRFMQKNSFETVSRLRITSDLANQIKNVLSSYIRHILEKDIKSANWLDSLRDQIGKSPV